MEKSNAVIHLFIPLLCKNRLEEKLTEVNRSFLSAREDLYNAKRLLQNAEWRIDRYIENIRFLRKPGIAVSLQEYGKTKLDFKKAMEALPNLRYMYLKAEQRFEICTKNQKTIYEKVTMKTPCAIYKIESYRVKRK